MKKTFILEELDCAHCASKMEDKIGKISGVNSCSISFLTGKLVIEADENDFPDIIKEAKKIIKKIEPDCVLIEN